MKKRLITPPKDLDKLIKKSADPDYAKKVMELPTEKKLHRSMFSAIATAACITLVATCMLVVALYRPFAPADDSQTVKPDPAPWYDLPIGDELFETIQYYPYAELVSANYWLPQTEKELFDEADVVVIGFAENTFTDENIGYFNAQYQQVESFDDAVTMRTLRSIKVVECLKGDFKEKDTFTLAARGYCVTDQNGNLDIADEGGGKFIQKQNVKYIFYMHKYGTDINGAPLYDTVTVIGCNNIDGVDLDGYRHNDITYDIFMTYADRFKKYDRTDEYKKPHDHRIPYAMPEGGYLPNDYLNYCCEAQAYEMADAVVVVTPSGDIKTEQQISVNPDKTVEQGYMSCDVKTLQGMTVLKSLKGETGDSLRLVSDSYWYYCPNTLSYELYSPPAWGFRFIEPGDVYILYLNRMPQYGDDVYRMTTIKQRVWLSAQKAAHQCNDPYTLFRYIDLFLQYKK